MRHIFVLSILMLNVFLYSEEIRESILIYGEEKEIFVEVDSKNTLTKYFLSNSGEKINLADYNEVLRNEEWSNNGNLTKRLSAKLNKVNEDSEVNVEIVFRVDNKFKGTLTADGKLNEEEAEYVKSESFENGKKHCIKELKLDSKEFKYKGKNSLTVKVKKKDLKKLKYQKDITFIKDADFQPPIVKPLRSLNYVFGDRRQGLDIEDGLWNSGGTGTGMSIGLSENPISSGDLSSKFFNTPITIRSGTGAASNDHAPLVAATVNNSLGTGEHGGGSPSIDHIFISPINYTEQPDHMEAHYDWLISQGVRVANFSWNFPRYKPGGDYWQNRVDRYWDIKAASSPYMLNVVSAGNAGSGSSQHNIDCRNYDPNDAWDEEKCKEIMWQSRNSIVVGAAKRNTNKYKIETVYWSSWKNGANRDLKPHIIAVGENINYPWGENASGTSFSAPAVASFAADLIGQYPSLRLYPEAVKAIIIAAGSRWPKDDENGGFYWPYSLFEAKGGNGVPNSLLSSYMADNKFTNYVTLEGTTGSISVADFSGYSTFYFSPRATNGATKNISVRVKKALGNTAMYFYITWFSNPVNVCSEGDECPGDDLDLLIDRGEQGVFYSVTARNSTEGIKIPILDWIADETWNIEISLFNRNTDQAIWGALAVTAGADFPPTGVDDWEAWVEYNVDDLVAFDGNVYKCLQAHTSQPDWTPPLTPALWQLQ